MKLELFQFFFKKGMFGNYANILFTRKLKKISIKTNSTLECFFPIFYLYTPQKHEKKKLQSLEFQVLSTKLHIFLQK